MSAGENILEVRDIHTAFGEQKVHQGVSFGIRRGTIAALIGGSGAGKTVMLKVILGLERAKQGQVKLFGEEVQDLESTALQPIRNRLGVLYQNGALFSSLSVGENIAAPIHEHMNLPEDLVCQIVQLKLTLTGLAPETTFKMPSELSGGMRKRVALARALALEPELLFLDEPTSGLDPINARAFDHLVRTLVDSLGITVLMITHDMDSLLTITNQVVVLGEGKVIADAPVEQVMKSDNPWVKDYFSTRAA